MTTATTTATPTNRRPATNWLPVAGLLLLTLIPVAAGASRLTELAGSPAVTEANARFVEAPLPVIVHIVTVTIFSVLGALQFLPRLRRGRPSWHRYAGRIVAPAGVLAALSGLWMAVFYALPATDGTALLVLRLIFGTGMVLSLGLGVRAILRRDVTTHRAWMMRGYAIGLGAGTQVLTILPFTLLVGAPDVNTRAVLMGAGWVINLVVAELVIRRRPRTTPNRTSGRVAPAGARLS